MTIKTTTTLERVKFLMDRFSDLNGQAEREYLERLLTAADNDIARRIIKDLLTNDFDYPNLGYTWAMAEESLGNDWGYTAIEIHMLARAVKHMDRAEKLVNPFRWLPTINLKKAVKNSTAAALLVAASTGASAGTCEEIDALISTPNNSELKKAEVHAYPMPGSTGCWFVASVEYNEPLFIEKKSRDLQADAQTVVDHFNSEPGIHSLAERGMKEVEYIMPILEQRFGPLEGSVYSYGLSFDLGLIDPFGFAFDYKNGAVTPRTLGTN